MNLRYTPRALEDLQAVKDSIIEKFDSEELANNVLKMLAKTARDLAVFPYMGSEVKKLADVQTDYRVIFCKKNYIFYRIEQEDVLIIRILNEKQDYMRILFGISDETEE